MVAIPNDWDTIRWDAGCGDGVFITILYHSKRFYICLLPPSSPDSIEGPLITRFDSAVDEGGQQMQDIDLTIRLLVYEAGKSLWSQLAPALSEEEKPADLHSYLYPETFIFRFITNNGKAELIPHEIEGYGVYRPDPRPGWQIVNDMGLPQYSTSDICVLETIMDEGRITRVLVEGKEMCCKAGEDGIDNGIVREYNCLRKLARSKLADTIRVPRLYGLVTLADTGMIIGVLEEYIPTGKLCNMRYLEYGEEASLERRQKWAGQIRETVALLHGIDVIWGNGKPDNVLIHEITDDAWVIAFGSISPGWVDPRLKDTLEGDEHAVGKILDFLKI